MNPQLTPSLPGFETIKRFWDKRRKIIVAKILPGEFYVSVSNELISTVIGSCVATCVWDEVNQVGGMNHFMLPVKKNTRESQDATNSYISRYGNWAMEYLVNEVIKQGGTRNNIKAKIFGGSKDNNTKFSDVGEDNAKFVMEYLTLENIPILANDTGGPLPRKIIFNPLSGKVHMKKLRTLRNDTVHRRERQHVIDVALNEDSSSIELF